MAGSECIKQSQVSGAGLREAQNINKSLSTLGLCIEKLTDGKAGSEQHVPYRDSKLTMMLCKGLGGNNMLHIILALSNSAEQVNEGTACLRFGQSCLSMTVTPHANKIEREQAQMKAVINEQLLAEKKNQNMILDLSLELAQ